MRQVATTPPPPTKRMNFMTLGAGGGGGATKLPLEGVAGGSEAGVKRYPPHGAALDLLRLTEVLPERPSALAGLSIAWV